MVASRRMFKFSSNSPPDHFEQNLNSVCRVGLIRVVDGVKGLFGIRCMVAARRVFKFSSNCSQSRFEQNLNIVCRVGLIRVVDGVKGLF